ncbi:unnamed protein product [Trichobilharzia szidati]|nr:unnamed protein product [Trichobilharzia szidati]
MFLFRDENKLKKLEDVRRIAAVNAKLWETRVEIAEKVKQKVQEHAKKLADDNAKLHDTLRQSEKETMEVFSYLKKENDAKEKELNELREKIEHLIASHEKDKELLLNDIKDQILCMNTEKEKECKRVKELESEIQQLSEYKSDRIRTENEIKQLRGMVESQKSLIEQMELKFFEEKKDKKIQLCENQIQNLNDTVLKQKNELQGQIVLQTSESAKSIERLTKTLELERKRMNRICGLASKILQQRSEIEEFFISSLDYVRDEIKVNQNNYIHDSKSAYEASLRLAHCGKSTYPPVRTFQNKMSSTNNVYDDFKIAHQMNSSDTSNCQNTEDSKLSISRESTQLIDSKRLTKRILDSIRSNNESSWREVDEEVENDKEEKERNKSCEVLQWQVYGESNNLSDDNNRSLIPSKDLPSLQSSNLGNIEEKSSRKKVLSAPDFRGEQTSTPYPSPETKDDITHSESAHSN